MKDLEKRNLAISKFVESKTGPTSQEEVSSIMLSLGSEGASKLLVNDADNCGDCQNWAAGCQGSINAGNCRNYSGLCTGSKNGGHCYLAPPPGSNLTVNCGVPCG